MRDIQALSNNDRTSHPFIPLSHNGRFGAFPSTDNSVRLLSLENYGILEIAWNEIERETVYANEARSRAAWFLGPLSPRRPFFKSDKHQQALIN